MISSRENYRHAIEFKGPQFLPCTLDRMWVNVDWLWEKDAAKVERILELQSQVSDDLLGPLDAALNSIEPVTESGSTRWTDEWGTSWSDEGHGERPVVHPLSAGFDLLADCDFPNIDAPGRFELADERLQNRDDLYVQGRVWFTLFERLWLLRGFENALIDPYLDPHNFAELRERVVEFDMAMIAKWLERKVDAIFFSDDWGTQQSLLIRPDDWRKLYKPAYQSLFDRVHTAGAHVWLHSCGNVTAILPDLIDLGLDVLNPVQPQAMNPKTLAREFGGKICFNGGVDIQGTMVYSHPDDVKREVHELIDLFGRYNGGYICGTSHTVMPETPLDNIIALFEAVLEHRSVC